MFLKLSKLSSVGVLEGGGGATGFLFSKLWNFHMEGGGQQASCLVSCGISTGTGYCLVSGTQKRKLFNTESFPVPDCVCVYNFMCSCMCICL